MDKTFRSLPEIQRHLKDIQERVRDAVALLRSFERKFTTASANQLRTDALSATFTIKHNTGETDGQPSSMRIVMDKVKKVVIPDVKTLTKNFDLADQLDGALFELQQMETVVKQNFAGVHNSDKLLAEIRRTFKVTEQQWTDALKFLQNVASAHVPKEFSKFVQSVIDQIQAQLGVRKNENTLYVRINKTGNFEFTYYVRLVDITDDRGFVHPQQFLVFTCELVPSHEKNTVNAVYYLNVIREFQTPGHVGLGQMIQSVDDATKIVGHLLDLDNIDNSLGTLPITVDPSKISKDQFEYGRIIQSFSVDYSSISFVFISKASEKMVREAMQSLYYELSRGMFRNMKGKLKMRGPFKELGQWKVTYTVTGFVGEGMISTDDLDFLRVRLGVSEDKLKQLVRVVNGY
jgi:hypothetical protein